MLTAQSLRQVLKYDPETGVFTRLVAVGAGRVGMKVGRRTPKGYLTADVGGKPRLLHRLVWLYMFGRWPSDQIDHINGDRSDNRLCNLRECSNAENQQNRTRCLSRSGFLGVSQLSSGRGWQARIKIDGKDRQIGTFGTPKEASEAYLRAKREIHEFWAS